MIFSGCGFRERQDPHHERQRLGKGLFDLEAGRGLESRPEGQTGRPPWKAGLARPAWKAPRSVFLCIPALGIVFGGRFLMFPQGRLLESFSADARECHHASLRECQGMLPQGVPPRHVPPCVFLCLTLIYSMTAKTLQITRTAQLSMNFPPPLDANIGKSTNDV